MNIAEYKKISSQLDCRIHQQAEREAKKAVLTLRGAVEAELQRLGIDPLFSGMHEFLDAACVAHINNLVSTRTAALVKQLVPEQQAAAPNAPLDEYGMPPAPGPTVACSIDVSVPPGATLIVECGQLLTREQKEVLEAQALAKLPAGYRVLVLDRGFTASVAASPQ